LQGDTGHKKLIKLGGKGIYIRIKMFCNLFIFFFTKKYNLSDNHTVWNFKIVAA
jgi:hypothetical protein